MSHLTPDISRSVTGVKAEALIDAPLETVWETILDFPEYPRWNTFVRSQTITDSSFRPLAEPPARPTEGARLLMHVCVPPKGLDPNNKGNTTTKEIITFVDETNHRIAWGQVMYPRWLLRAERWQEVTTEQVDGKTMTRYMTLETFDGPGGWVIRWFMLGNLKKSFEAMASGLKRRSEELAGSSPS